jgi:hypothetical protein
MPLDGPYRAIKGLGQGFHLGPAQPRLVACVVRESAVGGDSLRGYACVSEVLDLGYPGKLRLLRHRRLLLCSAAVRSGVIECPKAAGPRQKDSAPPLFLCSFSGAYSTYTEILALEGPKWDTFFSLRRVTISGEGLPAKRLSCRVIHNI